MIQQIVFTVIAFVLFVYILLLKMIKKNDTTYLIILAIQAIGILLNLIRISFGILERKHIHNNIIPTMYNITNSSFHTRNKKHKCIRNIKSIHCWISLMHKKSKKSKKSINRFSK